MGRKRRGKRRGNLLSRLEQDIALLSRHKFDDEVLEIKRSSLCRAFVCQESLTGPQKNLIHQMARPLRSTRRKAFTAKGREKHFVYAISDGAFIKIGYAMNPERRLKDLQVASPSELRMVEKIDCKTRSAAKRLERQCHKAAKKWHVRGEWFEEEALRIFDKGENDD